MRARLHNLLTFWPFAVVIGVIVAIVATASASGGVVSGAPSNRSVAVLFTSAPLADGNNVLLWREVPTDVRYCEWRSVVVTYNGVVTTQTAEPQFDVPAVGVVTCGPRVALLSNLPVSVIGNGNLPVGTAGSTCRMRVRQATAGDTVMIEATIVEHR